MLRGVYCCLFVICIAGCGADREPLYAQTRLLIRLTDTVPANAADRFCDETLSPLFPAGVTRMEARQQWRNADGTSTAAPCVIFDIIHLASRDNATRVDGAVLIAKRQFGAGAVMVVQGHPEVRF